MRFIAILILLMAWPAAAQQSKQDVAPGQESDKLAITITNADGHSLSFWGRKEDYEFIILTDFRLGGGQQFSDEMPSYQIDDHDMLETEWLREHEARYSEKWGDVGGNTAWWREWSDSENSVGPGMVLYSLITAKEIAISYRIADGSSHTTRFSLMDTRSTLVKATGLKVED